MILPPPSFFNEISFENDDCDPKKKKREEHILAILALIAFASMLAAIYILTDPTRLEYTKTPTPAGILWLADAISILSIILILFLFYDFFVKKDISICCFIYRIVSNAFLLVFPIILNLRERKISVRVCLIKARDCIINADPTNIALFAIGILIICVIFYFFVNKILKRKKEK